MSVTPKVSVFLVDNHQLVRHGLQLILTLDDRIEVVGWAGSGEEAIARLAEVHAQVVLMDIRLPGIDGIETTRRLLAQSLDIRVVMLGSFADLHDMARSYEAGARNYLPKTASREELVQAVLQAGLEDPASGSSF